MSENAPEQDWPTACEHCGTELQSAVIQELVTNDWNEGTPVPVLAQDVCPNEECPGRAAAETEPPPLS